MAIQKQKSSVKKSSQVSSQVQVSMKSKIAMRPIAVKSMAADKEAVTKLDVKVIAPKVRNTVALPISHGHASDVCAGCHAEGKAVRRDFSQHIWTALVQWQEIERAAVDKPICNSCYLNIRDVLIDRAEEIAVYQTQMRGGNLRPVAVFA
jgi:hypothetical protein